MEKVLLCGYMGSGKTVIGEELSHITGLKHLDLDKQIEENQQLSIPEIFDLKGEIYFRKLEHKLLKEILSNDENLILSLGGGTPCYANNHLLLNAQGVKSFYLKASVDNLTDRLKAEKFARPLICNIPDEELSEFIAKHLFDRSYYYNQCSYIINTDGRSVSEISAEINLKLA